jgi:hypothetical protein
VTPWQRRKAYLAILLFGLPSLLAAPCHVIIWPFHPYAQFAWGGPPQVQWGIFGIDQNDQSFWFERQDWLFPVGFNGMWFKFEWVLKQPDAQRRIQGALKLFYSNYEATRADLPERFDHGPLKGVELVQFGIRLSETDDMIPYEPTFKVLGSYYPH